MTARRDPDDLIKAFLQDGVDELPDRSYDAVRSEIDHTRQRVVIGPWRFPAMNNYARYGIAAAAIVLVAVLGFNLLPRSGQVGGPSVTARPTAAPTLTADVPATNTPTSRLAPSPEATLTGSGSPRDYEPIPPGRYRLLTPNGASTGVGGWPSTVIVSIPDGWIQNGPARGAGLHSSDSASFGVAAGTLSGWAVDLVADDPCRNPSKAVGPTVGDLVTALSSIRGVELTDQSDVTLAGFSGAKITVRVPTEPACDRDWTSSPLQLWTSGRFAVEPVTMGSAPGWEHELWILNLGDKRFVLDAAHAPGASPELIADLHAMVDSVDIEP